MPLPCKVEEGGRFGKKSGGAQTKEKICGTKLRRTGGEGENRQQADREKNKPLPFLSINFFSPPPTCDPVFFHPFASTSLQIRPPASDSLPLCLSASAQLCLRLSASAYFSPPQLTFFSVRPPQHFSLRLSIFLSASA